MTDNEPEVQRKLDRPAAAPGRGGAPESAEPALPVSPPPPDSKGENTSSAAPQPPDHMSEPKPAPLLPIRPPEPAPLPEPMPEPEPAPETYEDAAAAEYAYEDEYEGDEPEYDDEDAEDAEPKVPLTIAQRLRRLSPALVTMAVGSIGSAIFLAFAMTSHTTPVSVLLTAAVVTGLIFLLDSVVSAVISVRAALAGESGRALLYAMIFGVASVTCAGSFGALVILCITLGYF